MGKVCIVGCDALQHRLPRAHDDGADGERQGRLKEGDWISIDGFTGEVFDGQVDTTPSRGHPGAHREERSKPERGAGLPALRQADELGRRARASCASAPTPTSPTRRRRGRVRRRGHRPVPHRAHVLRRGQDRPDARDDPRRERSGAARRRWPSCCRSSARTSPGIFQAMDGRPVTIRLLDPPLHEFLPHDEAGMQRAGRELRA